MTFTEGINLKTICEYTKDDFIKLIDEIISDNGTEEHQDELLELFIKLAEHPAGSDLIYYPESEEQSTPAVITDIIQKWRQANGKPGFKDA